MNRKPFSTITSAVCAALTLFCIGGGVRHVGAGRDHDPRA